MIGMSDLTGSIVKAAAHQNRVRRSIRSIRQRVHANRRPPVIVSGLCFHIVQLQLVKSYSRDILARRRVRSRESGARPIPFRAANAAANCCRRYCEFFHSKGANAEAARKLNEIRERVASSQAQAKSALITQRAKVRTKRLSPSRRGKNRRFAGFGTCVHLAETPEQFRVS